MNVQDREILGVFGQRLDDHVRACTEMHVIIRDEAIRDRDVIKLSMLEMARKMDDLIAASNARRGGQAVLSWILPFGVAIASAVLTGIGILAIR